MMVISQARGWEIVYDNGQWVYSDNKESVNFNDKRPCKNCGRHPTPEGHNACLGKIDGVSNACCGHGIKGKAYKKIGINSVEHNIRKNS